jgi:hypothetical protein
MTKTIRAATVLLCLSLSYACFAAPKAKPKAPAAPATPEAGWVLGRAKDGLKLFYGMPDGTETAIAFGCVPRSGDVMIRVPADGKSSVDQSQSMSLTIGGVKSSFAGTVVDEGGSLMIEVIVTARNPMFTALGGPGGMRIEGKSFNKIVPLRGIGDKLKPFIASCRKG